VPERALDFAIQEAATFCICTFSHDAFRSAFPRIDQRLTWFDYNYGGLVCRHIDKVTSAQLHPQDLQDAYQETITALWQLPGLLDLPPELYLPVACGISSHKGHDVRRRQEREPQTNAERVLDFLEDEEGSLPCGGWQAADLEEFRVLLNEEIEQLA